MTQLAERREAQRQFVIKNIRQSWTWQRLTQEEREKAYIALLTVPLAGTVGTASRILNTVYRAFLDGTGYKPVGWREPDERPLF